MIIEGLKKLSTKSPSFHFNTLSVVGEKKVFFFFSMMKFNGSFTCIKVKFTLLWKKGAVFHINPIKPFPPDRGYVRGPRVIALFMS